MTRIGLSSSVVSAGLVMAGRMWGRNPDAICNRATRLQNCTQRLVLRTLADNSEFMYTDNRVVNTQANVSSVEAPVRLAFVDGLRGCAILLVILIHASLGLIAVYSLDRFAPGQNDIVLPEWLQLACGDAGHGVQLFFVVSAMSLTIGA